MRRAAFPAYKADRPPDRGVFHPGHIDALKEWAGLAGYAAAWAPGLEADDVIAHYATENAFGLPVVIVSGDHDFRQLLGPDVVLCRDSTRGELYTWEDLVREIECPPKHYREMLAITGDATDHIDGVKGVGQKTAVKILREAGWDLFVACQHPKLVDHFDVIMRNYGLVGFHPSPALVVQQPTGGDLDSWYEQWEFRSLMSQERRVAGMFGGGS